MDLNKERFFQHFKGGLYKMLFLAKDSETQESLVVYQAMYKESAIWVRKASDFFSVVIKEGKEIPRFRELTKDEYLCLRKETKNT